MPRLFTYTIPVDDGAAPNPFHGMCSLAICKPVIRRAAKPDDWIAGLGSKNAPSGDLSGHLVYAMRVEEVISLREYDINASTHWPHRIPNVQSAVLQDRLGDCIYDFSSGTAVQREGVHGAGNVATDLRGKNVLISKDFYYFGSQARKLPDDLRPICHQTQGHRRIHTLMNLFLGFALSSPLLGNSMVGPITLSNGIPFPHVEGAHSESSTMNLT